MKILSILAICLVVFGIILASSYFIALQMTLFFARVIIDISSYIW
ncbi:hypothetical protein CPT_Melville_267 [Salmonella phage Melville]|uniref:Uncharacterized protein n=1 Tax=Salmonella phage Melville TaxID=2041413 RepID=A0A2D1GMJ7_9CAUD|nr:hypothetical protein FDI73_gp134 [Salmonella phage Melville]ATN93230.1 hypothetical protein CPT_Melville_267 [Salmonella phage Melville]